MTAFLKKYMTVINLILFMLFFSLLATGLVLELRFDESIRNMTVAGFDREEWGEGHFFLAMSVLGGVVVHLLSNLSWILALFRRNKRLIFSMIGFFLLLAALVAFLPAAYPQ